MWLRFCRRVCRTYPAAPEHLSEPAGPSTVCGDGGWLLQSAYLGQEGLGRSPSCAGGRQLPSKSSVELPAAPRQRLGCCAPQQGSSGVSRGEEAASSGVRLQGRRHCLQMRFCRRRRQHWRPPRLYCTNGLFAVAWSSIACGGAISAFNNFCI